MSVNVPKKTHLALSTDSPHSSGGQSSVTCHSCAAGSSHRRGEAKLQRLQRNHLSDKRLVMSQASPMVCYLLPTNWPSCGHSWPLPSHSLHSSRGVFQKSDWVLFICFKPCDEHQLCFKVNPHPLSWLSRPSMTHLWSSLCPFLRPPHPYLCPPDIDHSFRASDATLLLPSETCSLCSHGSLVLECSALSLCVTVSCSSFRSQLKCHPL